MSERLVSGMHNQTKPETRRFVPPITNAIEPLPESPKDRQAFHGIPIPRRPNHSMQKSSHEQYREMSKEKYVELGSVTRI